MSEVPLFLSESAETEKIDGVVKVWFGESEGYALLNSESKRVVVWSPQLNLRGLVTPQAVFDYSEGFDEEEFTLFAGPLPFDAVLKIANLILGEN